VAIVSATVGEGKTTVVANTAMAAAKEGLNVLVLDADIGKAELTKILIDDGGSTGRPIKGMTDMVVGGEAFDEVVRVIQTDNRSSLSVLSFGQTHVDPISFFRSAETQKTLTAIRSQFDLVLIDVPPILEVAYAAPLLGLADEVIIVVPHGSDSSRLSDAKDRLGLLGVRPTGYVYNLAPLRRTSARSGSRAALPPDTKPPA
jgi:Mrp family chromosome partitioning ATPase